MRSALSIDIAAPPDLVFDLARDVTRWPRLLPHYHAAHVERVDAADAAVRVVRFVARRPLPGPLGLGLPVAWRSRCWAEPETRRLRFVHQGGATDGMNVTWTIQPVAAGSRVTISHEFAGPGLWPAFIDRFFTRAIAGRTLATFRAIAEALHASAGRARTNP